MKTLIVIPALNEEDVLRDSILAVRAFVSTSLDDDDITVMVVDNGSNDRTGEIGRELSTAYPEVAYLYLDRRGKGLAVRKGWESRDADAYVFMDADLATDLRALPQLLEPIRGGAGVSVGSRFHADSTVDRSRFRKFMSQGYRAWLRIVFSTRFSDAPCGFKAVSAEVRDAILPEVEDDGWFFDSELLVRAERSGHHICEVPVVWSDVRDRSRPSKVVAARLAVDYVKKTLQLRRKLKRRVS